MKRLTGLFRDIAKIIYLGSIQFYTRVCLLEREMGASVSLSARLDVYPRSKFMKRHRLAIGHGACIEKSSVINTWHGDVILEEKSGIGIGSIVIGPVSFGRGSACSQNCFVSGETHNYHDIKTNWREQGFSVSPVILEDNVWVGANCVVLPGVTIGRNSIVGAGSVVTKNIPPYSLAVGNPARVIKCYMHDTHRWHSQKRILCREPTEHPTPE